MQVNLFLILFLVLVLVLALIWRKRNGKNPRRKKLVNGIQHIRYWRQQHPNLEVTLIESSFGWKILDESDYSGNGVITVFQGPDKPTKTKKCFSLVRQSAGIYNRKSYQLIRTDCVKKFSVVKDDFAQDLSQVVSVSHLPRTGFEGILDYLKETRVIKS